MFRFEAGAPDGVPRVLDTSGNASLTLRAERLPDPHRAGHPAAGADRLRRERRQAAGGDLLHPRQRRQAHRLVLDHRPHDRQGRPRQRRQHPVHRPLRHRQAGDVPHRTGQADRQGARQGRPVRARGPQERQHPAHRPGPLRSRPLDRVRRRGPPGPVRRAHRRPGPADVPRRAGRFLAPAQQRRRAHLPQGPRRRPRARREGRRRPLDLAALRQGRRGGALRHPALEREPRRLQGHLPRLRHGTGDGGPTARPDLAVRRTARLPDVPGALPAARPRPGRNPDRPRHVCRSGPDERADREPGDAGGRRQPARRAVRRHASARLHVEGRGGPQPVGQLLRRPVRGRLPEPREPLDPDRRRRHHGDRCPAQPVGLQLGRRRPVRPRRPGEPQARRRQRHRDRAQRRGRHALGAASRVPQGSPVRAALAEHDYRRDRHAARRRRRRVAGRLHRRRGCRTRPAAQ